MINTNINPMYFDTIRDWGIQKVQTSIDNLEQSLSTASTPSAKFVNLLSVNVIGNDLYLFIDINFDKVPITISELEDYINNDPNTNFKSVKISDTFDAESKLALLTIVI